MYKVRQNLEVEKTIPSITLSFFYIRLGAFLPSEKMSKTSPIHMHSYIVVALHCKNSKPYMVIQKQVGKNIVVVTIVCTTR